MLLCGPRALAKHVHHVDHLALHGWASIVDISALLHVVGSTNEARVQQTSRSWFLSGSWHGSLHLGRHHHAAQVHGPRFCVADLLALLFCLFLLFSRCLNGSLCSVEGAADSVKQSHFIKQIKLL